MVGVSFVRFFDALLIEIVGWTFLPIGVATFAVGSLRYHRLRRALAEIKPPPDLTEESDSEAT